MGFTGTDVQRLAHLAALDNFQSLAERGSKEPVLGIVDVLAQTVGGVHHVLCIFHGGGQRLLADDVMTCVHSLDGNVMVQEVGHTDVHQIAVALGDGGIIVVIDFIALKAVAGSQSMDTIHGLVADTDDLHLVLDAAVAVGMKVGREGCADQQHTKLFHDRSLL